MSKRINNNSGNSSAEVKLRNLIWKVYSESLKMILSQLPKASYTATGNLVCKGSGGYRSSWKFAVTDSGNYIVNIRTELKNALSLNVKSSVYFLPGGGHSCDVIIACNGAP